MNKTKISMLVVLAGIVASSVLVLGTMTQTALAQTACSSGASTDVGSSSTSSGADFFAGECSSSSASGAEAASEGDGERTSSRANR